MGKLDKRYEPPLYSDLQQFLDRRLHTLESLQPARGSSVAGKAEASAKSQTRSLHTGKQDNKRGRCSLCSKDHFVMLRCWFYKGQTAESRRQHLEANNLCLNCLGKHKLSDCTSKKTCSVCQQRHHTSIHDTFPKGEAITTSHLARRPSRAPTSTFLATARVRVADRYGAVHVSRALIDQGSESSLVSESLSQRLKLLRSPISVAVFGVGGRRAGLARSLVTLRIESLGGGSSYRDSPLATASSGPAKGAGTHRTWSSPTRTTWLQIQWRSFWAPRCTPLSSGWSS